MLATKLDNRSIGVLLRVMDMQEARAQGAVLRLMGQRAADSLIDSGLLAEDGIIPIVVMMDDYEDEPVAAEWSPEHKAYGYREKSGRWVEADHRDIAAYKVDFPRAVAGMLVQFDRAGSPPPRTLVDGYLLDLGVIRLAGAENPLQVWFARCLGNPGVWQKVVGFIERRPPVGARIILTSTRGERIPPSPNRRDVIVAVSDVLAGHGSLAISPEILRARVFPGQVQRREPIDHSENCGVVWLRGEKLEFGGDKQRAFLEILFDAYWAGKPIRRTSEVLSQAGFKEDTNSVAKAFSGKPGYKKFIRQSEGNIWIEP